MYLFGIGLEIHWLAVLEAILQYALHQTILLEDY
jgi:hypothetical protein